MSTKPAPVARTAAFLAIHYTPLTTGSVEAAASLASRLHRFFPGFADRMTNLHDPTDIPKHFFTKRQRLEDELIDNYRLQVYHRRTKAGRFEYFLTDLLNRIEYPLS